MQKKALFRTDSLLQYMIDYLDKKIDFETIPDSCLYYIEEPGSDDTMKDKLFRKVINEVYSKLIDL